MDERALRIRGDGSDVDGVFPSEPPLLGLRRILRFEEVPWGAAIEKELLLLMVPYISTGSFVLGSTDSPLTSRLVVVEAEEEEGMWLGETVGGEAASGVSAVGAAGDGLPDFGDWVTEGPGGA